MIYQILWCGLYTPCPKCLSRCLSHVCPWGLSAMMWSEHREVLTHCSTCSNHFFPTLQQKSHSSPTLKLSQTYFWLQKSHSQHRQTIFSVICPWILNNVSVCKSDLLPLSCLSKRLKHPNTGPMTKTLCHILQIDYHAIIIHSGSHIYLLHSLIFLPSVHV
jgi:hypothetical protein